jgi:acetoin utilization deacetylase AcuC-like enzyme
MTTAYGYDDLFLKHDYPGHPEGADRLKAVMQHLEERKLLEALQFLEPQTASVDEIARVHSLSYIEQVRRTSERGGGHLDPDTYTNSDSFAAAMLAAGALLQMTRAVVEGAVRNGFALIRPPGHHALRARGMGFCIFNNVAVAAREALRLPGIERILIYDFDVHHGNGTQAAFESDPQVLFISTHQYPHYPGTGATGETGTGEGAGTLVNIPLPPGVGDRGYAAAIGDVAWPIAQRYHPDLILVSAGFDAHWSDPLAMMALSLTGYAWIAQELRAMADEFCDGRIVFTLEGGYNLGVLAHGVENVFHALLGDGMVSDPLGPAPTEEGPVVNRIAELRRIHRLA